MKLDLKSGIGLGVMAFKWARGMYPVFSNERDTFSSSLVMVPAKVEVKSRWVLFI